MEKLYLGTSKTDITPNLGCQLYGYSSDVFSDSIHDRLHSYAYVFEQGGVCSALISVTVCLIQTALCNSIRKQISKETNIPYENIIIAATHTHTGPNTCGNEGWGDLDTDYCQNIFIPGIIESVKQAASKKQAVTVGYAFGDSFVGVNRRELKENNGMYLGQCPWGPFNPRMTVISFKNQENKVVASLVHYGAHCTAAGSNTIIGQDWPGVMIRSIEELTGAMCAFFNGPEGDVGPRLSNGKTGGKISDVEEIGNIAAIDATKILSNINDYKNCNIKSVTDYVSLKLEKRVPYEFAKAEYEKNKNADIGCNIQTKTFYKNTVLSYEQGYTDLESLNIEQTLIRIGNIIFVTFPYELFSEIGLRIQRYTKDYIVLSLSNSNGSEGYFPTEDQLCRGGYEIAMFMTSRIQRFSPNADYNLIAETLKNIEKVI